MNTFAAGIPRHKGMNAKEQQDTAHGKSMLRKSHVTPRKEHAQEELSDDHGRLGTGSIGA